MKTTKEENKPVKKQVKKEKSQNKKNSFLNKLSAFFKSYWNNMKTAFKKTGKVVKDFILKSFHAVKKALKIAFVKTVAFFKNLFLHIKDWKKSTKVLVVSVIVLIFTMIGVFTYVSIIKQNDLSTYYLLSETTNFYEGTTEVADEFFSSELIDTFYLQEASRNYVLFKAFLNNYNYYVELLKNVKYTNNELRKSINEKLVNLNENVQTAIIFSRLFYNVTVVHPDEGAEVDKIHRLARNALENVVNISIELLPQIENYIYLYGQENSCNKLDTYLTKLQFHYASVIRERYYLGIDITLLLEDLDAISTRYSTFSGTSTSQYQTAFIEAYENFNAYPYYAANSKVAYYQSLLGQDKLYAQAFYNFLSQENYN